MKDVQKLLRKRGTDSIDWEELRDKQDLVDLPDEDEEGSEDFGWGLLVGLGAAALAYFLLKPFLIAIRARSRFAGIDSALGLRLRSKLPQSSAARSWELS